MFITILNKIFPLLKKIWLPLLGVAAGLMVGHVMWSQRAEISEAKKEVAIEVKKNVELDAKLKSVTVAKITGPTIHEKKQVIEAPDGTITINTDTVTSGGTKEVKQEVQKEIKYVDKEVIKYVDRETVKIIKPLPLPKWEESLIIGVPALDFKATNVIVGAQVTRRFEVPLLGSFKVGVQGQVPLDNPKGFALFAVFAK